MPEARLYCADEKQICPDQVCNKIADCLGGEDEKDCAVNDSKPGWGKIGDEDFQS